MTRSSHYRFLIAAFAAGLFLSACKSDQEKLIDLRFELRRGLDGLYGQYGGGQVAKGIQEKLAPGAGAAAANRGAASADTPDFAGAMAAAVGEADRASFDEDCLAIGRAERRVMFTQKAQEFFGRTQTQDACRKLVILTLKIEKLERAVGEAQGAKP
jgi:hypothetical protein